jgi:hypothetical protein
VITINSGANTVYATLREKKTLDSPTYVFIFIHDQTLKKHMVYNTDLSDTAYPRSKFTITQSSNPTWYQGGINLTNYGDYTYYAYECNDVVALDYTAIVNGDIRYYIPTYFTTLLETGKLVYEQPTTTDHAYKEVEDIGKAYVPSI